jgi:hypothetical protein
MERFGEGLDLCGLRRKMAQCSEDGLVSQRLLDLEALEDGAQRPVGVLALHDELLAHLIPPSSRPQPVGVWMLTPA